MAENSSLECPDCGNSFPLRTTTGLCQKCLKLKDHKRGTADYEDIEEQPQCVVCGLTRRNNMHKIGQDYTCGSDTCAHQLKEDGTGPQGSINNSVPETYRERAAKTLQRFKLNNQNAGTNLHTAALLHHERGSSGPGEEQIRLAIITRLSTAKGVEGKIGNIIKGYGVSQAMPDILKDTPEVVNPQFMSNRLGTKEILLSEVSFRWSGNRLAEPNSATGTLANFYKMHSSTQDKVAAYIDNIPQQFKRVATSPKSKMLCLEFNVNMDMYRERLAREAEELDTQSSQPGSNSRKRTVSESSVSVSSLAKRDRAGISALGSRFSLHGRGALPLIAKTQSPVTLQKFTISVDPANFEPEIIKIRGQINGMMWDNHFAKGAMKVAFDLILFDSEGGEERVVAKRLYRISDDDPDSIHNHISLADNRLMLEAEATRLVLDIKFAQAYLLAEIPVAVTRCPSAASGLAVFDGEAGMTWLVESKRASVVISFTSTLDHKARGAEDIQSETVHAFAHYAFGYSGGDLVFADLQGTPTPVRGSDGLVLFDPMTHTMGGGSGLGDFGIEGIETFINTHECNRLCTELRFEESYPLQLPEEVPGPDGTDRSGSEGGHGTPDGEED
ncbi:kinase-like domain-containing protein [Mycena galericulata]|nr:kinase-like domain-containing protein [Mycena galericulata]